MRGIIAQKRRTAESNPPPGEYLSRKYQNGPQQFSATSAAVLCALGGKEDGRSLWKVLPMFVFLMLFMLVAPLPVLMLAPFIEPLVIHVGFMPLLEPVPVSSIFALIPVVIIAVIGIVDSFSTLPFLLLVPFMIVLRAPHRQRSHRR